MGNGHYDSNKFKTGTTHITLAHYSKKFLLLKNSECFEPRLLLSKSILTMMNLDTVLNSNAHNMA